MQAPHAIPTALPTAARRPFPPRDRRYRRSDHVPRALAYQCAHVQQALDLEAVVVSDDAGDHWVGAGDRPLCRLLSRSAPVLAHVGRGDIDYQLKALRSLHPELGPSRLTTFTIRVPDRRRYIHVAGVGRDERRSDGVAVTAGGVRRILGFENGSPVTTSQDATRVLQQAACAGFLEARDAGHLDGFLQTNVLGRVDDRAYAGALCLILRPVDEILERSGLVSDDPWRGAWWRSSETRVESGAHVRFLRAAIREPRSGARVATMKLELHHMHSHFEIPCPPRLELRWRNAPSS